MVVVTVEVTGQPLCSCMQHLAREEEGIDTPQLEGCDVLPLLFAARFLLRCCWPDLGCPCPGPFPHASRVDLGEFSSACATLDYCGRRPDAGVCRLPRAPRQTSRTNRGVSLAPARHQTILLSDQDRPWSQAKRLPPGEMRLIYHQSAFTR